MDRLLVFITSVLLPSLAVAQPSSPALWYSPRAENVVVPQARAYAVGHQMGITVERVRARVSVRDQVAVTTLDVELRNPGPGRQEAELLLPVPEGAVLTGFDFRGKAAEPTAKVLPHDEAHRTYHGLVALVRDPALLEFAGYNLVRTSVFPLEPYGTQAVRLVYEGLLPADGDRIDYVLPRSDGVDQAIPWDIGVAVLSARPVATIYSPSHALELTRRGPGSLEAALEGGATTVPGPFRMSVLLERRDGVTTTVYAFPDPHRGGGFFLAVAGLPSDAGKDRPPIPREVTLVVDRSGSMNEGKLDQVKQAAGRILAGLRESESFNLIVYHQAVDFFAAKPVLKKPETLQAALRWLDAVDPAGGTNIHDALLEALRPPPLPGLLPLVIFLTDGLPTVGNTSESVIRELAVSFNPARRRIFTFGVGVDVNTPLLEKLASSTRAAATFVLPGEPIHVQVEQVFRRLSGPVLSDPVLHVLEGGAVSSLGRVRDMVPAVPPDLFEGDQLVVAGRYVGEEPVTFELAGNWLGERRSFRFTLDPSRASTHNGFVPRLWASRQIAVLVDVIRQAGADSALAPDRDRILRDPRLRELVQEIIRLSTEFGILTEYTAFFAAEGTPLADPEENAQRALENFVERAVRTRSGLGSVNQDVNRSNQARQQVLNPRNAYLDDQMNPVESSNVQQSGSTAFWRQGRRWVDGRLMNRKQGEAVRPSKVIRFGSGEYVDLVDRLA
ncbi:MAG: VWA domain-containing protein, partial [Deltaproteobacteria bacterium]|nr:VWA domain-containing protein [Deltaproteobacteria bacterium]